MGSMVGLVIWDRVLVFGEVLDFVIGKEYSTGIILILVNVTLLGGFV